MQEHTLLDWAEVAVAIGTGVAALVSLWGAIDARLSAGRQAKQTLLQQRETERQARVALEQLLGTDYAELRHWADDVVDEMSEAIFLSYVEQEAPADIGFYERRGKALWRLSSLLDRGRFFLPNLEHETRALHKYPAFRGIRQPALDDIKTVFDLVRRLRNDRHPLPSAKIREGITDAKRHFVSEIHEILGPRQRRSRLEKLAGSGNENSSTIS